MKYTADGTRTGSPDMTGQDRTVEANATACQDRCQNTDGCSYFTWWGNDGGCHLQNSSAIATDEINNPELYGVISGPKSCNPAVHCIWDEWILGECSTTCGAGTRTNTRVKLVEESNGGTCD